MKDDQRQRNRDGERSLWKTQRMNKEGALGTKERARLEATWDESGEKERSYKETAGSEILTSLR